MTTFKDKHTYVGTTYYMCKCYKYHTKIKQKKWIRANNFIRRIVQTTTNTGCFGSNWTKLNSYYRQKTIHGVKNMICTCSLGLSICVFSFRMVFEHGGWPLQPPTFSSNSTKITKNAQFWTSILTCWRLCWLASKFKIHYKGKKQISEPKEHVHVTFLTLMDCFLSEITI